MSVGLFSPAAFTIDSGSWNFYATSPFTFAMDTLRSLDLFGGNGFCQRSRLPMPMIEVLLSTIPLHATGHS